jgi:RNA polymerase sigma-70 factor (ECF subfamily)
MQGAVAPSDNDLVARSLRGDTDAFGTLVLRYREMVIGVAYRLCGDAALAEDVAQETFIRVWDKLSTFRPEGNFRAWLARIATNLTIDALRRRKPVVDIADLAIAASGQEPETVVLKGERAAAVREALMQLPLHSRMVLVLREYEALSYQEIADALDIPLGTVKSRLNDARRRLKAELAGYIEA